jgi:hypothetical protein
MAGGKKMNNKLSFILWLLFLACIIIPAAVIVNFNLGDSQFQIELDEYLANNKIPASPDTNTGSLSGGAK